MMKPKSSDLKIDVLALGHLPFSIGDTNSSDSCCCSYALIKASNERNNKVIIIIIHLIKYTSPMNCAASQRIAKQGRMTHENSLGK